MLKSKNHGLVKSFPTFLISNTAGQLENKATLTHAVLRVHFLCLLCTEDRNLPPAHPTAAAVAAASQGLGPGPPIIPGL